MAELRRESNQDTLELCSLNLFSEWLLRGHIPVSLAPFLWLLCLFKKNRTLFFFLFLSTFFILERLDFCVIIEKRWKSVWNNSGLLGILAWYLENLFLVHDFRSKSSVDKDQHLRLGAASPSQPPQSVERRLLEERRKALLVLPGVPPICKGKCREK